MIQLFRLRFHVPNGFRIGSKVEKNVITQLRIDNQTVLIPASSWKGVFRRVSEIVLNDSEHFKGHSVEGKEVERVKDEVKELVVKDERFRRIAESRDAIKQGVEVNDVKKLVELYKEYKCPIERLYGGKYFAGAVTFSDTVLENFGLEQRFHVSIDRKTRKSLEKNLFAEEIVYVNSVEVKVIVRGEFELWRNTLKFLRDVGYFIGAGKSRGIGYIRLDDKESVYAEVKELSERPKFDVLSKYIS